MKLSQAVRLKARAAALLCHKAATVTSLQLLPLAACWYQAREAQDVGLCIATQKLHRQEFCSEFTPVPLEGGAGEHCKSDCCSSSEAMGKKRGFHDALHGRRLIA